VKNRKQKKITLKDIWKLEMAAKKETRGGTRSGSGAKPKYNEPTTTIAFRCPISKVDELKKVINTKLAKWAIKI
jgi:hypothetical protein